MAKKVATNVVGIHETTREARWFRAGDTVPAEYQKSLSNPAVYAEEAPAEDEPGEAPAPAEDEPGEAPAPAEDEPGEAPAPAEEDEPGEDYDDIYDDATNDDLRAELANRGLAVHGNKSDLIARLREDDAEEA